MLNLISGGRCFNQLFWGVSHNKFVACYNEIFVIIKEDFTCENFLL